MKNTFHVPVLIDDVIDNLNCRKGGVYIDCTLGGGGHSKAILKKLYPHCMLIGIDQDIEAINESKKELEIYSDRTKLIKGNFKDLKNILSNLQIDKVSGIIFDLGVSFHQLSKRKRGFSFRENDHLDMRMDVQQKFNADILVNTYSENDLVQIFQKYGEERFSKRIARRIVQERKNTAITTTKQLSDLIIRTLPKTKKRITWRIHPATRVFQSIRIEVNQELEVLEGGLKQAIDVLEEQGRICVISYHSLEDRIVKLFFKERARTGFGLEKQRIKILTKKPIRTSTREIEKNPKARSAKLRVAEKIY
jgi:16S rRNA (cytosine1402-N4)-methyltransferase